MTVLVDSCVLLDLATEDPRWLDWSIGQITTLLRGGERLAINPLIFAEVSAGYDDPATAGNALPHTSTVGSTCRSRRRFAQGRAF